MIKLSGVIITYNEERNIEKCLQSLEAVVDEIVVVDSFSTDSTKQICSQYNVKFIEQKFLGYIDQKNFALQYATGEWVLFIDADERIPFALKQEILDVINNPKHAGYKLNFPHFYMNRFLYHHYDSVLRLVKRANCKFEGLVHEKLIIDGSIGQLKNPVLHFTYKGLEHYISKKDSYAWFQAEQMLKKGKKATYFHLAFKPFYRFFSSYILRRGFMDGIPGLAVASINAYGVFSRYAKLMLLKKGIR